MAEHGGYRRPGTRAAVSGPGAHSQRTDRGPRQAEVTGLSYGEAGALQAAQSAAPLRPPAGGAGGGGGAAPVMPTGLDADSEFPDQPVTAGADAGPGPGMADIGIAPEEADAELRSRFGPVLPVLMRMADSQYSTDAFRKQVRELAARIQ